MIRSKTAFGLTDLISARLALFLSTPSFQVSVTLVEASEHILGTFDRRLVDYVGQVFQQRKVKVLVDTSVVKVGTENRREGGR